MSQPSIRSLPEDVWREILVQLPYKFLLGSCASVSRQFYGIINNPKFLPWTKLYHRYKLAPSTNCPTQLVNEAGGGGGGGGGDGGKVLTADEVVECIVKRHEISDVHTYLAAFIRAVGSSHQVPNGTSSDLLQSHRLYQLAQDTLARLHPDRLPPPYTPWHVAATIVMLSRDVWDIHELSVLMLWPGSVLCPGRVVEGFYSMALLLLYASRNDHINLPSRYHYQVFYAVHLYEHAWEASPGREEQGGSGLSVRPTHEQLRLINHPFRPNHVVKMEAFAGSGKTTTLLEMCRRQPDKSFLLMVFSKAAQMECKRTFPQNVEVRTFHSLAFASVGTRFKAIGKFQNNLSARKLCNFLSPEDEHEDRFRRITLAKDTLENYCNSANEDLEVCHVPSIDDPDLPHEEFDEYYEHETMKVLDDAAKIWDEMKRCSPDQTLSMTQSGQLKLWQLSHPDLNMDGDCSDEEETLESWPMKRSKLQKYDVIMVDDGQDMNSAMLDIFLGQSSAKVIAGDPYQQIYSFRGAVDILERVRATHRYHLIQSFRFGPEVAYVTQKIMEKLNKVQRQTVVGGHKHDSFTATLEEIEAACPITERRTAYLAWSNFELYKMAISLCQQEDNATLSMVFAGGLDRLGLDTLMDIYTLSQGAEEDDLFVIENCLIAMFESVSELEASAKKFRDADLLSKIKMFEFSGSNTPDHIQLLRERCSGREDEAQITFSTIHKSKSLEWDHVVVLEDNLLKFLDDTERKNKEKFNLVYVAASRSKKFLTLNNTMKEVLKISKEALVAGNEVQEYCECLACDEFVDRSRLLVTKVFDMNVMNHRDTLKTVRGGYLCHTCAPLPGQSERQ